MRHAELIQAQLLVPYDPKQRRLYELGDRQSLYHDGYPRKLWRGIFSRGRFPEVAVKAALEALGFRVFISDPGMPRRGGYILTHYAGKRRTKDPAFTRMFKWFPEDLMAELNRECDKVKREIAGNMGGGDPDLFVVGMAGDRFFVEVKDQDELITKQLATFPKIAKVLCCDVLVARVVAKHGARPGDGLQLVPRPVNRALPLRSRARAGRNGTAARCDR